MCGINGAFFTDSSKETNRSMFEGSLKSLAHRGPDNQSSYISNGIALGHNRLSIIDLSEASNQPFFTPDKKYAIVFNGEIFNYKELRTQFEEDGHKFKTQSDTEVLLQLLIKFGVDGLNKVNGFFVFAFYDFNKHELLLARDRFGEKPLFYYLNDLKDEIYFGSELKAVVPFLKNKKHSSAALKLLMHLSYIPAPFTIIEGVNKLEPGSFIKIFKNNYVHNKWYKLNSTTIESPKNENEIFQTIRNKFELAVKRRMVSDVPVAGFLSGGIDSTLVSAIAKELNPAYETFSLGFDKMKFFDESSDAENTAKKFGISHTSIKLSEAEMLENVFELLDGNDEPFGDSSMIALYSLCKKIKGKYKVILSGDGADEVFAGYNKHLALFKAEKNDFSSLLVKKFGGIHKAFPKSRNSKLSNKARQLEKMHAIMSKSKFDRYWFLAGFNSQLANQLLPDNLLANEFKINLEQNNSYEDFNNYLFNDISLVLPNDMLYKVDFSSMLNSLEIRSPFLDHELIEYAFSIPGELKIKNGTQKYLLKNSFKKILSEEIIKKPKHGFEVPLQNWLIGPLKPEVDRLLSNKFILDQAIFNPIQIGSLVKKLNSKNPGDTASTTWTLLNFQYSWLKYFNA